MKKLLGNDVSSANKQRFLSRYLNKFPFFKRIKLASFEKKYMPGITFEEKKKGDLVMLPSDKHVYIVLNGKIVLREHKMEDPLDFDVV